MIKNDELSRIATLVGDRIEELKGVKTQKDIAREVGYTNQNMITMIKQGKSKVAIDKAGALGKALEVDPKTFMLLALEQFYSRECIDDIVRSLKAT